MALVPALMGKTEDQARDALAGVLDVEKVERNCSAGSGTPNTIYESIPRTGDSVSRATRVLLRVKDDCVTVPRLVGISKAAAFAQLNSLGLQRGITDLGERARGKKLKPEEVEGSTFTITNPGQFGAVFGLPIINQPNSAIMGVGGITKMPLVVTDKDGADSIAIRSVVHLTLGYDHRLIDGAVADQFMAFVKKTLEGWSEDVGKGAGQMSN